MIRPLVIISIVTWPVNRWQMGSFRLMSCECRLRYWGLLTLKPRSIPTASQLKSSAKWPYVANSATRLLLDDWRTQCRGKCQNYNWIHPSTRANMPETVIMFTIRRYRKCQRTWTGPAFSVRRLGDSTESCYWYSCVKHDLVLNLLVIQPLP